MPEKLYRDMQTIAMAANFHKYGVAIKTYQQSEAFQELFTVISTNHDDNGMEYIQGCILTFLTTLAKLTSCLVCVYHIYMVSAMSCSYSNNISKTSMYYTE